MRDLIDVSRIKAGKLRIDARLLDVKAVVEDAIKFVSFPAKAKGITLETAFCVEDCIVSGDPKRLQQVIWNLLSNAIKFTPDGGQIQLFLETLGTNALVTVRDTGRGIDPKFLPHIFEPFHQAHKEPAEAGIGLGLGLTIARHIVELHSGTIQVKSLGKDRGTTFTVKLPLAQSQTTAKQDVSLVEKINSFGLATKGAFK